MRFSLLFIFTVSSLNCANSLATLTVFELANNIVQNVVDISKRIDSSRSAQENTVLQELGNIILSTKELSDQLKKTDNDLDKIPHLFQKKGTTELNFTDIGRNQIFLDNYFNKMEEYVMDNEEYTNTTLIKFANTVVSPLDNSVPKLIDFIHQKLTEGKFLEEFSQLFEPRLGTDAYFCKLKQSPSQVLQNFLIEVLILKTKSFVLIQGAYMFKKLYQKNFVDKMDNSLLDDFEESTNRLVRAFKPYIDNAFLELWKCDPEKHEEGITFVQVKNFLHGYILNKVNLDPKGKCNSECETYNYVDKTECYDNEWCINQMKCSKIVNCGYVDQSMTVYTQNMSQTNRRYDYIEFGTGTTYGIKNISSNGWFLKTYTTWWFTRCSYCFCLCDEGPKYFSDRYINMRLTLSNINKNKVVTGLRFVKHNGIIHLQIQEGKVMEKGQIDVDSIRWVPPHDYSRTDRNVKEGKDYHTLSWNQRGFKLKDIMADDGYVVTGVRFLKIGDTLHLEPLVTHYDFTNGTLGGNHFQEGKKVNQKFEKKLKLKNPDIPILSPKSDVISANMKVEFTHSNFEKDAGQTTVPFFDAQPVESAVPVPLSGIGIIHRGRSGYGGFIAPRIFTYNFTQHLTNEIFKLN